MSRKFTRLGSLLLLVASTGCSALGNSHSVTGITPATYVSKRTDSQLVNAHYETLRAQSPESSVNYVAGR